ncbi:hypothetical protein BV898_12664 [Hypsibius exemplaris]|uniref:Pre-SET domain-containing protein n=1 Tax=Hypsibius exemplaris TaxID=2072580 RepID=A0A1W0WD25_HYPEX|nr:hypothetical protein BV898_12664 [Hypsibius exemplaris]
MSGRGGPNPKWNQHQQQRFHSHPHTPGPGSSNSRDFQAHNRSGAYLGGQSSSAGEFEPRRGQSGPPLASQHENRPPTGSSLQNQVKKPSSGRVGAGWDEPPEGWAATASGWAAMKAEPSVIPTTDLEIAVLRAAAAMTRPPPPTCSLPISAYTRKLQEKERQAAALQQQRQAAESATVLRHGSSSFVSSRSQPSLLNRDQHDLYLHTQCEGHNAWSSTPSAAVRPHQPDPLQSRNSIAPSDVLHAERALKRKQMLMESFQQNAADNLPKVLIPATKVMRKMPPPSLKPEVGENELVAPEEVMEAEEPTARAELDMGIVCVKEEEEMSMDERDHSEAGTSVVTDDADADLLGLVSKLHLLSIKANPAVRGFLTSGSSISTLAAPASPAWQMNVEQLSNFLRRLKVQPTRWAVASRHIYTACKNSDDVLSLLVQPFIHHLKQLEKARKKRERQPRGESEHKPDLFLKNQAICSLSPFECFLMRPTDGIEGDDDELDLIKRITVMRDEEADSVGVVTRETVNFGHRPDSIRCESWAGKSDCGRLVGYAAQSLWQISRQHTRDNLPTALAGVRFCEDHVGAIVSRNFCPVCLKIETFSEIDHSRPSGEGLICRGPSGFEMHYFHPRCASLQGGSLVCPHCGCNEEETQITAELEAEEPDWNRKMLIGGENGSLVRRLLDEQERHSLADACQERTREPCPSMDTTVAVWAPLGPAISYRVVNPSLLLTPASEKKKEPTKARPTKNQSAGKGKSFKDRFGPNKRSRRTESVESTSSADSEPDTTKTMVAVKDEILDVTPIKPFFMPNLQCYLRETSLLEVSDARLILKYAAPLMTLSGNTGGCFCREACVPDICPCLRWSEPDKCFDTDGRLTIGFDTRTEFIQECSEVCSCCVDKCANRVTQMPSKVSLRFKDGKVMLSQSIKQGTFVCRIGGTLEERQPDLTDRLPYYFYLPKFGVWPSRRANLCIADVRGPARYFVRASKLPNGKPPTVTPVLVVQCPMSNLLNMPRQLAVPTVAFFASHDLPARTVLSYGGDFVSVNSRAPTPNALRTAEAPRTPITDKDCLLYERRVSPAFSPSKGQQRG